MASDAWTGAREQTEILGRWLRRERERRNMFLLDVAQPLGIDKPTLSRIERGEVVPNPALGEQLTVWALQQSEQPDVPVARTTDPETSHEAAASVKEVTISATRRAILEYLDQFRNEIYDQSDIFGGTVAEITTDEAIAHHLEDNTSVSCSRSGVSTRRLELQRAGFVEDSGSRGHTMGGRRAIAWRITELGVEALSESLDQEEASE